MEQVLLVIQVLLAIALIIMVLIQRSDTDGFGLSGGGNNLLSGRTTANVMTRTTAIIAALFIINSLGLSIIAAQGKSRSIIETIEEESKALPAVPTVPLAGETKGDSKSSPAPLNAEKATKDSAVSNEIAKPVVPNADAAPAKAKKSPEFDPNAPGAGN